MIRLRCTALLSCLGVMALTACHKGPDSPGASSDLASTAPPTTPPRRVPLRSPPPRPAPCPTTGHGAVLTDASCIVFTPVSTGAAAGGVNASVDHYALAPARGATGRLVLFMSGSMGTPAGAIEHPSWNLYTAGIAAGDHVLSIAYRNERALLGLCQDDDACYLGTRMALLTGAPHQDAADEINQTVQPTEGIYARTALALAYLAVVQPAAGWSQYLHAGVDPVANPAGAVRWSRVFAVGHSQGGGHAALLARLHPLGRLVTLASPCDRVGGAPASWLNADASWETPAWRRWGFAAPDDRLCPGYSAIWTALDYPASHRFPDATLCPGQGPHAAPLRCAKNMPRVRALLTP